MLHYSKIKGLAYLICMMSFSAVLAGDAVSIVHSSQTIYKNALGTTGYTISEPGYYTLGEDIDFSGSLDAITIACSYVTLDMNNRTICYTGGSTVSGIRINSELHDITVKNGTLSGFIQYGIVHEADEIPTYNVTVSYLDITNTGGEAIRVLGRNIGDVYDWCFSNCTISDSRSSVASVFMELCNNIVMRGCKVNANRQLNSSYVVDFEKSSKIVLDDCSFCDHEFEGALIVVGFRLCGGCIMSSCIVNNNIASEGSLDCILFDRCGDCIVDSCVVNNNSGDVFEGRGLYGIALIDTEGSVIKNSTVSRNSSAGQSIGIALDDGFGNVVEGVEINYLIGRNTVVGLYLNDNGSVARNCNIEYLDDRASLSAFTYGIRVGGTSQFIEYCTVLKAHGLSNPSTYGICLDTGSRGNVVYKCKAIANWGNGFNDSGTSNSVTGCFAFNNGFPLSPANYTGFLAAGVPIASTGAIVTVPVNDMDNISVP